MADGNLKKVSKIFDFLEGDCGRLRALALLAHSAGREEKFARYTPWRISEFKFIPTAALSELCEAFILTRNPDVPFGTSGFCVDWGL
jgi:hypothetical protein